jgi:hypothetical protein
MANTSKDWTDLDMIQLQRAAFNEVDYSMTTAPFVVGKVGRTITNVITTTTSTGDTVTSTYSEGANTLYVIKTIYTDNTYKMMLSQTRLS